MRNQQKLAEKLRNYGISHTIFELQGGCMGISHTKKDRALVMNITELMGYSFLMPYEYEYSYKQKPMGDTIIY